MINMKSTIPPKSLITAVLLFVLGVAASAQCETWIDSPSKEQAENAHTVYRQSLKDKDYELAFEHWEKAYELAPAADGRRDYHYTDGAILYKQKLKDDPENRAMYLEKIDMFLQSSCRVLHQWSNYNSQMYWGRMWTKQSWKSTRKICLRHGIRIAHASHQHL